MGDEGVVVSPSSAEYGEAVRAKFGPHGESERSERTSKAELPRRGRFAEAFVDGGAEAAVGGAYDNEGVEVAAVGVS